MHEKPAGRLPHPVLRALWNMRLPGLFICGPVVGLVMVDAFFGLPGPLWLLGGGFFAFSLVLFAILIRGETRRIRCATRQRASDRP